MRFPLEWLEPICAKFPQASPSTKLIQLASSAVIQTAVLSTASDGPMASSATLQPFCCKGIVQEE